VSAPHRPFVWQTPLKRALLAENFEHESEAKTREQEEQGIHQSYEAFMAGNPCPACHRPFQGSEVAADDAAFRLEHASCPLGFWGCGASTVRHCLWCCPMPPASPAQIETLRELLRGTPPARSVRWHLTLTCGHTCVVTTGDEYTPITTKLCAECSVTRGVVEAAHGIHETAGDTAGAVDLDDGATPAFHPLTDEQWIQIKRIVAPEETRGRGRPRADARTMVNGILYREHTGIAWRELPSAFGSWQTTARWHRRLIADNSWKEVLQVVANSDAAASTGDEPPT
jgi:transposase